ncbi:TPA: hypothetical protein ACSVS8_002051 [Legionella pneumophila]
MRSAKILVTGNNKIDFRNATSRAYYSALHKADIVAAKSNGISKKNSGLHAQLIQKLKSHTGSTIIDDNIRQIGVLLGMCKKYRVNADYKINHTIDRSFAQQTISLVEQLLILSNQIP